jgi:hypothetical protein
MKKIICGSIAVLAIAATIVFNVNLNAQGEKLSDVSWANVEALADGESGSGDCKWKSLKCNKGTGHYEGCLTNGDGNSCSCGSVSRDC